MRSNVTSGLSLSLCAFVCALTVLLSVSDRAYAKRGCSAFGHSCFGGHGKRFDSHVRNYAMLSDDITVGDRNEQYDASPLSNKLFATGTVEKFRGLEEIPFPETQRQTSRNIGPYGLSLLVRQWLASHRRSQHSDMELNNK